MRLESDGQVIAVSSDSDHRFSKRAADKIELIAGKGVIGDAHFGSNVQHLSRVKVDPNQPNLRQVHLIHSELFDELREIGFSLNAGDLGENILTQGIDLLNLGRDTILKIGGEVSLQVTGLRNPCQQIDNFMPGLLSEVAKKEDGVIIRKAGIMSIVMTGGTIQTGDAIIAEPPSGEHIPLERV